MDKHITIPRARLAELEAIERQVAEGEVLERYRGDINCHREWASVGTWLYPGDRIVVLRSDPQ